MVLYISFSKNYFHLNNSLLIHNFDLNGCYYIVCYYSAILLVLVFILLLGVGLILYTKTNQPESNSPSPLNPNEDDPSKNPKETLLDKMKRLLKKGQKRCEEMESKALEDSKRVDKILTEGLQKQEEFRARLKDLKDSTFDA